MKRINFPYSFVSIIAIALVWMWFFFRLAIAHNKGFLWISLNNLISTVKLQAMEFCYVTDILRYTLYNIFTYGCEYDNIFRFCSTTWLLGVLFGFRIKLYQFVKIVNIWCWRCSITQMICFLGKKSIKIYHIPIVFFAQRKRILFQN